MNNKFYREVLAAPEELRRALGPLMSSFVLLFTTYADSFIFKGYFFVLLTLVSGLWHLYDYVSRMQFAAVIGLALSVSGLLHIATFAFTGPSTMYRYLAWLIFSTMLSVALHLRMKAESEV